MYWHLILLKGEVAPMWVWH